MTTSNQTQHDPICHMDITIEDSAGSSDHDGKTYYFCSRGCKLEFDESPEKALAAEAAYDHSQPMDHGTMVMMDDGMTGAGSSTAQADKKPWWKFW